MQYWKLLDGLITAAPISSTCAAIIKEGQAILASASRSQTPVSSQAPPPYVSPAAPSAPLPSTTSTSTASSFVALTRSPSQDQLSPDDEATLEEAAAVYDSQSQPLPPGPLSSQPPSFSSPAVRTPQDPLRPILEKMCSTLDSVLAKVSSSPPQPLQAYPMILKTPKSSHPMVTRSRAAHPRQPATPAAGSAAEAQPRTPNQSSTPRVAAAEPSLLDQDLEQELEESEGSDEEGSQADLINLSDQPFTPAVPGHRPRGPGALLQEDTEIQDLDQASLKELRKAVHEYGPQAPYTLSCLESLSFGGKLFPVEWRIAVRRCLKPPEIVLWEAEFRNNCKEYSRHNKQQYLQMAGLEPFDTVPAQRRLSYKLLSLTSQAGFRAWKAVGSSSGPNLPLSKIQQGDDEPYHAFISRLLEAIDRTTGITSTSNPLVLQLAFENANPTCRQLLKAPKPSRSIEEMISLCKGAHTFATQVAGALVAFQGQSSGKVCYSCGKPGHFTGKCPERKLPDIQAGSTSARPSLCPRCRRGRHWKDRCRATTDIEGNYLGENPSLRRSGNGQGNSSRGNPSAPRSQPRQISFVPATGGLTGNSVQQPQHRILYQQQVFDPQPPPSSVPPPVQPDLTCVPPPPSY